MEAIIDTTIGWNVVSDLTDQQPAIALPAQISGVDCVCVVCMWLTGRRMKNAASGYKFLGQLYSMNIKSFCGFKSRSWWLNFRFLSLRPSPIADIHFSSILLQPAHFPNHGSTRPDLCTPTPIQSSSAVEKINHPLQNASSCWCSCSRGSIF